MKRLLAVMAVVSLVGCGDGASQDTELTSATVSTPADSGGSVAPAPECPDGEYPAVGAFDLATGAIGWSTCSPDEAAREILGATEQVVLVVERASSGTSTVALDAEDGTERWRRSTLYGGIPRGPLDGNDIVVLVTDDQGAAALVGVDVLTGVERWRVDGTVSVLGQTADVVVVFDGPWQSPPPPSKIRGIDRSTGTEMWWSDVVFEDSSGTGVARGAAAVWEDIIAVPTGSTLTGVDMSTGEELWTASQIDHPEAADGVVVGAQPRSPGPGQQGSLTAVDAATGALLWSAPGQPSYGDLLAVGDGVVVALDTTVLEYVAYELSSGDERWRATRQTGAQPQLIEGTSVVMLWEGTLAVMSTTDGSTIWSASEPLRSTLMNSAGSNATTVFVAANSVPWSD